VPDDRYYEVKVGYRDADYASSTSGCEVNGQSAEVNGGEVLPADGAIDWTGVVQPSDGYGIKFEGAWSNGCSSVSYIHIKQITESEAQTVQTTANTPTNPSATQTCQATLDQFCQTSAGSSTPHARYGAGWNQQDYLAWRCYNDEAIDADANTFKPYNDVQPYPASATQANNANWAHVTLAESGDLDSFLGVISSSCSVGEADMQAHSLVRWGEPECEEFSSLNLCADLPPAPPAAEDTGSGPVAFESIGVGFCPASPWQGNEGEGGGIIYEGDGPPHTYVNPGTNIEEMKQACADRTKELVPSAIGFGMRMVESGSENVQGRCIYYRGSVDGVLDCAGTGLRFVRSNGQSSWESFKFTEPESK
jgi:hypothetical protein